MTGLDSLPSAGYRPPETGAQRKRLIALLVLLCGRRSNFAPWAAAIVAVRTIRIGGRELGWPRRTICAGTAPGQSSPIGRRRTGVVTAARPGGRPGTRIAPASQPEITSAPFPIESSSAEPSQGLRKSGRRPGPAPGAAFHPGPGAAPRFPARSGASIFLPTSSQHNRLCATCRSFRNRTGA